MTEQQEFLDYLRNPLRVQLAEKMACVEKLLEAFDKTVTIKSMNYDGITLISLRADDRVTYDLAEDIVVYHFQDFCKYVRCVGDPSIISGHGKIFYISEKGFD